MSMIVRSSQVLARSQAMQFSTFKKVGVVGAGLLGHGIAQTAAEAGYRVAICDTNEKAIEKGVQMIEQSLKKVAERNVKKGTMDAAAGDKFVQDTLARIETKTTDLSILAKSGCDLIVEAIVENIDIKKNYYKKMGQECPPSTILASNTSSLSINELAEASGRANKVIGLHYFNPVQMMQLVEVISTPKTEPAVKQQAFDFVKSIKKTPVDCKDTPGFIVNRLLVPFLAEAMAMVDRGDAKVEDIDTAMKLGAGLPMGPLYLADYIGLDTCLSILKGWTQKYPNENFFVPKVLEKLVAEGKLGRKTGEGFYPKSVWAPPKKQ